MSKFLKITAPKSTLQSAPIREVLTFPRCVIPRGTLIVPSGHVGLTGLWIEYQGKQVLPENPEQVYRGNGVEIEFYPNLPILEPPFELEVLLFNEDDTYQHSDYLTFDVVLEHSSQFPDTASLTDLNAYFSNTD